MKSPWKKLLPATAGLVTLCLLNTSPAAGQSFVNLHNFTPFTTVDGASPNGGMAQGGNTLYGVTAAGGSAYNGTVFKINTDGSGYAVLYSFSTTVMDEDYTDYNEPMLYTNTDGYRPNGGLVLADGRLYGTTPYGGLDGYGTIFSLDTNGGGFTLLHTFTTPASYPTNSDGLSPEAGLILAYGTLYGTTSQGGDAGYGTVFSLNTTGTGYTVLKTFAGVDYNATTFAYTNVDGAQPQSHLILAGDALYGTANTGGQWGSGTAFCLNTNGTGFASLHDFSHDVDGQQPGALTLASNRLFGTCSQGGIYGAGTIFGMDTNGGGFGMLCSFGYGGGGSYPDADLVVTGNLLYGATQSDGANHAGTLFAINTDGTGFNILYTFSLAAFIANSNSDGTYPNGLLVASNVLYGTAGGGGSVGRGTVFSLNLGTLNFTPPNPVISLGAGQVVITWPANAGVHTLQSATNLNPPVVWADVPTVPVVINGQNVVTNVMNGVLTFYRLFP